MSYIKKYRNTFWFCDGQKSSKEWKHIGQKIRYHVTENFTRKGAININISEKCYQNYNEDEHSNQKK